MLDLERIEYLISGNATLAELYPIHKEVAAALPTLIAAAKRERVMRELLSIIDDEIYDWWLPDGDHFQRRNDLSREIQEALK